jgi:predicted RecA/RadA family phage recombinase
MANDCIPIEEPGDRITCVFAAAATGKTFVAYDTANKWLGPAVSDVNKPNLPAKTAAAGTTPVLGVLAYDVAAGATATVLCGAGFILPVTAGAAIAAGAELEVTAGGKVITSAGTNPKVGMAVQDGTNNNDVFIMLY